MSQDSHVKSILSRNCKCGILRPRGWRASLQDRDKVRTSSAVVSEALRTTLSWAVVKVIHFYSNKFLKRHVLIGDNPSFRREGIYMASWYGRTPRGTWWPRSWERKFCRLASSWGKCFRFLFGWPDDTHLGTAILHSEPGCRTICLDVWWMFTPR